MALADADRLREEDPFTGQAVADVPTHVIVHRSRFEFDLNRGADERGLSNARAMLGPGGVAGAAGRGAGRALARASTPHITGCWRSCSTTSRRGTSASSCSTSTATIIAATGPDGAPTPQDEAPDINIGTFSMPRDALGVRCSIR